MTTKFLSLTISSPKFANKFAIPKNGGRIAENVAK
jgi:hypothetical protein